MTSGEGNGSSRDHDHTASVKLKPSDVLAKAADLIEPEGAWLRRNLANDRRGRYVDPTDKQAVCWCAAGAMQRYASPYSAAYAVALSVVHKSLRTTLATFNDAECRTQAEVVAVLRKASTLARSEGC